MRSVWTFVAVAPLCIYATLPPTHMGARVEAGADQQRVACTRTIFVTAPRAELSDATPSRLPGNAFSAFRGFRPVGLDVQMFAPSTHASHG